MKTKLKPKKASKRARARPKPKRAPRWRIVPDYDRARAAFDILVGALEWRLYPFGSFVSFVKPRLEKPLPEDSRQRAIFWMCLCFWMRGRIESYEALWRLARVWHADPELFEPSFWAEEAAADEHRERLSRALKAEGLAVGVDKYHAADWAKNLRKLHRFWGGDPRNLIVGAKTFDDLLARIENRGRYSPDREGGFRGFRRKMVAMLAHFLSADDLAHAEEFPFPVDIHVGRLLLYVGALRVEYPRKSDKPESWDVPYEDTVGPAIQLCLRYMAERGVSAVTLGDAVWNFAQTMCAEAPQNRWLLTGEYEGRKTRLAPVTVEPTRPFFRRYLSTCRCCPLRDRCVGGTIGTAPYFYWGTFSRRPTPDLEALFEPLLRPTGTLFDIEPTPRNLEPLGKPQRAWRRMSEEVLGPGLWLRRVTSKAPREAASSDELFAL